MWQLALSTQEGNGGGKVLGCSVAAQPGASELAPVPSLWFLLWPGEARVNDLPSMVTVYEETLGNPVKERQLILLTS